MISKIVILALVATVASARPNSFGAKGGSSYAQMEQPLLQTVSHQEPLKGGYQSAQSYQAPMVNSVQHFQQPAVSYSQQTYSAPVKGSTKYEAPVKGATQYEAPVKGATQYEAPVKGASQYEAPVKGATQYEAPVHQAPVYQAPVYQAPVYQAPAFQAPVVSSVQHVEQPAVMSYSQSSYSAPAKGASYQYEAPVKGSYSQSSYRPMRYEQAPSVQYVNEPVKGHVSYSQVESFQAPTKGGFRHIETAQSAQQLQAPSVQYVNEPAKAATYQQPILESPRVEVATQQAAPVLSSGKL